MVGTGTGAGLVVGLSFSLSSGNICANGIGVNTDLQSSRCAGRDLRGDGMCAGMCVWSVHEVGGDMYMTVDVLGIVRVNGWFGGGKWVGMYVVDEVHSRYLSSGRAERTKDSWLNFPSGYMNESWVFLVVVWWGRVEEREVSSVLQGLRVSSFPWV